MAIKDNFKLEVNEIKKNDFNTPIIFQNVQNEEKMMSIILISSDETIHYSIICKKTDNFSKIEELLYEKYPEYKKKNIRFTLNGEEINTSKNLEFNNIKNGDIITLRLNN